jgi:hypothetical protein
LPGSGRLEQTAAMSYYMIDAIAAIISIIALLIGLPVLILRLRDRIANALRARRNSPENLAANRRNYEQRILRPDWEFYERHLERPVPPVLRELYTERELITAQGFDYSDSERISTFGPLDVEGSLDTQPLLGFDAVAIATNEFGDPIYLRPGFSEPDIVYITHHDGGDTEIFAESVSEFLDRLRLRRLSDAPRRQKPRSADY